ncbi:DUF2630 family protein [Arthrobacter sp. ISL-28]|uniref:DUF2630 family protein n=1 Tax=Arthrobacter sp. ISL-28 TaxID=2819108 RepID=UPI001BE68F18|nr:DUF2630 family protein [Arthrobacter sp. ISL-28]MBT2523278.1 DUF2630 family protein [Arthrobacter sp. ISL-28]
MDNQDILDRIQALVDEEHQLRASAPVGPESEDVEAAYEERRVRLRRVEEDLDQCWDLLRQRRAKENAESDPGQALTRPASEVEGYRQ